MLLLSEGQLNKIFKFTILKWLRWQKHRMQISAVLILIEVVVDNFPVKKIKFKRIQVQFKIQNEKMVFFNFI